MCKAHARGYAPEIHARSHTRACDTVLRTSLHSSQRRRSGQRSAPHPPGTGQSRPVPGVSIHTPHRNFPP